MLFREQQIKLVYLQISNKFQLPREIMLYIYNHSRKQTEGHYDLIRKFYKNIIILHTLNPIDVNYYALIYNITKLTNPYQYLFPIGRGLEWPISQLSSRISYLLTTGSPNILNNMSHRDKLLSQIKMMGDKDFLNIEFHDNNRTQYIEATIYHKIAFMNNNLIDTIVGCYANYFEWKNRIPNDNEWDWRIIISDYQGNYYYFD